MTEQSRDKAHDCAGLIRMQVVCMSVLRSLVGASRPGRPVRSALDGWLHASDCPCKGCQSNGVAPAICPDETC